MSRKTEVDREYQQHAIFLMKPIVSCLVLAFLTVLIFAAPTAAAASDFAAASDGFLSDATAENFLPPYGPGHTERTLDRTL